MNQGIGQFLYGIPKKRLIATFWTREVNFSAYSSFFEDKKIKIESPTNSSLNKDWHYNLHWGSIPLNNTNNDEVMVTVEFDPSDTYLDFTQVTAYKIDISQLTNLKGLYLGNINTGAGSPPLIIDFSNNLNLEILTVDNTQINNFDISMLTNKIKRLSMIGMGLTSFDLTPFLLLEHLSIYKDNHVTIDVSQNTNLSFFNCRYNMPNLTTIYVNQTQLNKLNASPSQLPYWHRPATANYVLKT